MTFKIETDYVLAIFPVQVIYHIIYHSIHQ